MESNKKVELDKVTQDVLNVIDSYGFKQEGAYNLRLNGMAVCHGDTRHINIVKKEDKPGIDIHISGEAKDEMVTSRSLCLRRALISYIMISISRTAQM